FFFQAEDGIRDATVTGVQTCALPISTHDAATAGGVHPAVARIVPLGCQGSRRVLDDESQAEIHRLCENTRESIRGRASERRARMGRRALGCAADEADGGDPRRLRARARAVECPLGVRLFAVWRAAPRR